MSADDKTQRVRRFFLHPDPWMHRAALSETAAFEPFSDCRLFEDYISNPDLMLAVPAFLGVKRLCRISSLDEVKRALFKETTEILEKRAFSGPTNVRLAAIRAIAFASEGVSDALMKRLAADISEFENYRGPQNYGTQELPLVQESYWNSDWAVSFAALLATLPLNSRSSYIERFLSKTVSNEEALALPALLSLQMAPSPDFTEYVLPFVRAESSRVAIEAARALSLCGGRRIFHLMSSLFLDIADPGRKAFLIPLLARSNNFGILKTLTMELRNTDPRVRKAAVSAIGELPIFGRELLRLLGASLVDAEPAVAAEAARVLAVSGIADGMLKLEEMLRSSSSVCRERAAFAMGCVPGESAILPLLEFIGRERNKPALRIAFLSLRRLLSQGEGVIDMKNTVLGALRRLFLVSDPFLLSQTAVLTGMAGLAGEELLSEELLRQRHPYVIASLIGAFRRLNSSRILVLTKYADDGEARIRANLMEALGKGGPAALPYLINGLHDSSPRVQASAAEVLFKMGRLESAAFLNRMLMIPSMASVIAACRAVGSVMRFRPNESEPDHPLTSALIEESRHIFPADSNLPLILRDATLPSLFAKLSVSVKNPRSSLDTLERHLKSYPRSYAAKRLSASFLAALDEAKAALNLLESCLIEHPGILADLLDAYRLAARVGDFERAERFGSKLRDLYGRLFDACIELATVVGSDSYEFARRMNSLRSPSMNLYSAMIQLKAAQGDEETVLELLAELLLARPGHKPAVVALADKLPKSAADLKTALAKYADAVTNT